MTEAIKVDTDIPPPQQGRPRQISPERECMRSLQVGESFLAKNLTERQIWNIISNEHRFSPEKRFTSKDKRLGAGSVRVIRNTKAFPNG